MVLLLAFSGSASAHTNCETYGSYTLLQWRTNQLQKCGFTGPLWESRLVDEINWCEASDSVEPTKRLRERRVQLAGCLKGKQ
jgi:hypothetical protein